MIITQEILEEVKTEKGGYTKKALAAMGIDWPPYNGWKNDVIGRTISDENAKILMGEERMLQLFDDEKKDDIQRKKVSIYVHAQTGSDDYTLGKYTVILSTKGKEAKISKTFYNTTLYRTIIQGAIDAIEKLRFPCEIELYMSTAVGMNMIVHPDGSWKKKLPSKSPNGDLLLELKEKLIEGHHIVHSIIDKDSVISKVNPEQSQTYNLELPYNTYTEVKAKCVKENTTIDEVVYFLLKKWLDE